MARVTIIILVLALAGCYSSRPIEGGDPVCVFTYAGDSGRGPVECSIYAGAEETCLDAAHCICGSWMPDATGEEIEECAYAETIPRGAITLADFCGDGTTLSLPEALSAWAADRGASIDAEERCSDLEATLDWFLDY